MSKKNTPPIDLQLQKFRWPITAIASITHRITAVIIWFGLGILLASIAYINESPLNYEQALSIINNNFFVQFALWGLLSAIAYYCLGTIKHLIQDLGYCEDFVSGKIISWIAILSGILLSFAAGIMIWV